MQKITPFLWFDGNAEEAMNLYVSLFKNSRIQDLNRGPDGSIFSGSLELDGQPFMVLNAPGRRDEFTEAISIFVNCETQEEIDGLWAKLTADGGEESMCGWLKDKFGLSWQIIPSDLGQLIGDPDPERSKRAMDAMLQMRKIDIHALRKAHAGT